MIVWNFDSWSNNQLSDHRQTNIYAEHEFYSLELYIINHENFQNK
jgi:hypothetical protein